MSEADIFARKAEYREENLVGLDFIKIMRLLLW